MNREETVVGKNRRRPVLEALVPEDEINNTFKSREEQEFEYFNSAKETVIVIIFLVIFLSVCICIYFMWNNGCRPKTTINKIKQLIKKKTCKSSKEIFVIDDEFDFDDESIEENSNISECVEATESLMEQNKEFFASVKSLISRRTPEK